MSDAINQANLAKKSNDTRRLTIHKKMDGGLIAADRDDPLLGDGSSGKMLFGTGLARNSLIKPMLDRENFFLTVLIPRSFNPVIVLRAIWSYLTVPRLLFLTVCFGLYFGIANHCASLASDEEVAHSMCNGGPTGDGGVQKAFSFVDYRSVILNSLATLLLSFYSNLAITEYKMAYYTCQTAKSRIIDLMTVVVADLGDKMGNPKKPELLLELWRSANLTHLAAYCLADKNREVYSFENFLLPVAMAFGPYDGEEQLGMFHRSELVELGKEGLLDEQAPQPRGPTPRSTDRSRPPTNREVVGDQRGDMRSDVALIYNFFLARLYRLVRDAARAGLTTAPFPVWHGLLLNVKSSNDEIQRRGLYRMPKIYKISVLLVVTVTLMADSLVMGTVVGRVYQEGYEYADYVAVFATTLLAVLLVPITLLVASCMDMEEPFGSNSMDMPGLSYVRGAAEPTLNMIVPHPLCQGAASSMLSIHPAIFDQSNEAVEAASSSPSKPTPNLGRIASGMSLNNARRPDSGLDNLMEKLEAEGMTGIVRDAAAAVLFEQGGHVGKALNMLKSGGSEAAKKALAAA